MKCLMFTATHNGCTLDVLVLHGSNIGHSSSRRKMARVLSGRDSVSYGTHHSGALEVEAAGDAPLAGTLYGQVVIVL